MMTMVAEIQERPILFSSEMIRAILDGRKTQTRRVIKRRRCPYGKPGDLLWVRETWLPFVADHVIDGKRWAYKADQKPGPDGADSERCRKELGYKWRPSIFMPREACRITLEIVGVRVQRLQDISYEDCMAEGCPPEVGIKREGEPDSAIKPFGPTALLWYGNLWTEINGQTGPKSWQANPWVWVVEFKRIER